MFSEYTRFLISYVQFFNKRYERIGKLINDRYLSRVVKDDSYVLNLVRYIHQNPVKIGLPIEYQWSSYSKYFKKDELVDSEFILSMLGEENFIAFNNVIETRNLEPNNKLVLSDSEIVEEILEKYNFDPKKIIFMDKIERNNKLTILRESYSIRKISKITGISHNIVAKQKTTKQKRPRNW